MLTGTTEKELKLAIRLKDFKLAQSAQMLYPTKYSVGPADDKGYDGSAKAYDPNEWGSYQSPQLGTFTRAQIAVTEAFFDYLCSRKPGCDRKTSDTVVSEVFPQEIPYPSYYKSPFGSGEFGHLDKNECRHRLEWYEYRNPVLIVSSNDIF